MSKGRELPRYPHCFVCGGLNARGLGMSFTATQEEVVSEFELPQAYIGFPDRIHGGVLIAVVDEAMTWACAVRSGKMYYTCELNVRFKRPVTPGVKMRVEASCTEIRRWIAKASGRLVQADGTVCVDAEGVFRAVPDQQLGSVLDYLEVEEAGAVRSARPEDIRLEDGEEMS